MSLPILNPDFISCFEVILRSFSRSSFKDDEILMEMSIIAPKPPRIISDMNIPSYGLVNSSIFSNLSPL